MEGQFTYLREGRCSMANSSEGTTQEQQQYTPNQTDDRMQASIDSSFFEQIGFPAGASPSSLGYDFTSQVLQSYFETPEAQVRQTRRMADLWAQSLILTQTTNQIAKTLAPVVAKQVIAHLQQNPSWVQDLVRH